MNIAIDLMSILGPTKNRGIGYYTTSQLKALFTLDKENNYFLLNLFEDIQLKDVLYYDGNVSEYYFNTGNNLLLWEYPELIGEIYKNFILEHKIDLFYITSPFDHRHPLEKTWFVNTKYIVTIYDLIPYIFPNEYLKTNEMKKLYKKALELVINSDGMLAISQSVKNDLLKYNICKNKNKIKVINAGADINRFHIINISEDEKLQMQKKYGIFNNFILCVGGDDERKNIAYLIEAYSHLSEELRLQYQLVIVCHLPKSSEERYYTIAKKMGVVDRVVFTKFVSDEDLTKLYNMAFVSAFVSKYEGFGLPVLESMMCGVPVLTSNNSSLVEIAGDAAILVDPFDITDIVRGLNDLLSKTDLDVLRKAGFERAKSFSWEKTAKLTLDAICNVTPKLYKPLTECNCKRIAFFTPLPPIQSVISNYSVDIINKLVKHISIDVFIDIDYSYNCLLPQNVNVYKHTKFFIKRKKYDKIIFQLGNNNYHEYMLGYIRKYNGIVVLHDYNLNDSVLNFADIIIVNSKWEKKQLLIKNIEANVQYIHNYVQNLNNIFYGTETEEINLNKIIQEYIKVLSYPSKIKTLTNQILSQIINNYNNTTDKDKYSLAKTLAYTMQNFG